MQIDRYTKAMLTLIAGSLLALVAQNAIRSADAQSGHPSKVIICDLDGSCAKVVATDSRDLRRQMGSLSVQTH